MVLRLTASSNECDNVPNPPFLPSTQQKNNNTFLSFRLYRLAGWSVLEEHVEQNCSVRKRLPRYRSTSTAKVKFISRSARLVVAVAPGQLWVGGGWLWAETVRPMQLESDDCVRGNSCSAWTPSLSVDNPGVISAITVDSPPWLPD